ncbi:MAG: MFS transporter [Oscillospiraceae bacterium]
MKKNNSHAWIIVIACFIMSFAEIGIVINCSSVFLKPVSEAMGFTRTQFSLCTTILTLAVMVSSLLMGKLIGKVKLKPLMLIGVVLSVGGFVTYSFSTSLPMFYVASALIGLGSGLTAIIPCSVMLTNWFVEKRGLAIGIAFTGSGFGGMIFAPLSNWIITTYGWQTAYLVLGITIAVLTIPVCLFMVCLNPAEKGMTAYGATETTDAAGPQELTGIAPKAFFKTKSFWLLAIVAFLVGLINLGVLGQIPAHLTDNGLSATFATGMVTLYMAVLIVGKILLGAVYDKKGIVFGTLYLTVLFVAAMAALILSKSMVVGIIFACVFGFAHAMTTVTNPLLTANIAGPLHYAEIYAVINLFFNIGMAFGAPISNAIYDAQGKYDLAFVIYAVVSVLLAVGTIVAYKSAKGYNEMKATKV